MTERLHPLVLEERKAHPTDKKDLLTLMLTGKDKETGLGLSEDNIKRNVSRAPLQKDYANTHLYVLSYLLS